MHQENLHTRMGDRQSQSGVDLIAYYRNLHTRMGDRQSQSGVDLIAYYRNLHTRMGDRQSQSGVEHTLQNDPRICTHTEWETVMKTSALICSIALFHYIKGRGCLRTHIRCEISSAPQRSASAPLRSKARHSKTTTKIAVASLPCNGWSRRRERERDFSLIGSEEWQWSGLMASRLALYQLHLPGLSSVWTLFTPSLSLSRRTRRHPTSFRHSICCGLSVRNGAPLRLAVCPT